MPEPLNSFAKLFGAKLNLNEGLIVKKGRCYYLLNQKLKEFAEKRKGWSHVGVYLGKKEKGLFHSSFPLLFMVAEKAKNKITVDDKTAWLFVCGRDVFKEGILQVEGSREKGNYTLVFNRHGECLGYGKIIKDLYKIKSGAVVENILDVGDFLRREKL
jgi:ribosome biogenesis protein Nip4